MISKIFQQITKKDIFQKVWILEPFGDGDSICIRFDILVNFREFVCVSKPTKNCV